jgi:hypothetical protein
VASQPDKQSGTPARQPPRGVARRGLPEARSAIPKAWEIIICVFVVMAMGMWGYGVAALARGSTTDALTYIGGGAGTFLVLFVATHRNVKARRRKLGRS